jgi:hypothetical protein
MTILKLLTQDVMPITLQIAKLVIDLQLYVSAAPKLAGM